MLAFLRRRRDGGKRALGEAVTGIPAAPRLPVVPRDVAGPVVPDVGRVELGFRDGTTAVLEPTSPQARELRALADLLRGPQ